MNQAKNFTVEHPKVWLIQKFCWKLLDQTKIDGSKKKFFFQNARNFGHTAYAIQERNDMIIQCESTVT